MDSVNSNFIYLDYNATTPVDERVLNEMLPFFSTEYANPSGSHLFSLTIQDAMDQASEDIADKLGTQPKISFSLRGPQNQLIWS
ncbi:aminotransferase class V-fold PLP-dependent enzyme [Sphingobacterium sp. E70]|uniref:aminotransferase class V-fold PLP-dependent enzyme n=1 Tax=Sphingobacterium sp. E70 TaxID=2853439 RepID=UPI00211C33B6|nr:aminotransferase class V-fold PLP-dependent enzyme [Sphingobacterium sp. E70]